MLIDFHLQHYNAVKYQGSWVCGRIWNRFSLVGDNREDGEAAALVFLSLVIPIWTGSWQEEPQWIETSSVSRPTWEIFVAQVADEPQGSQTDTKRLQSSAAFSLGCEDWDCLTEIEKLLSSFRILKHWIMNDGSCGLQFASLRKEMLICLTDDSKLRRSVN